MRINARGRIGTDIVPFDVACRSRENQGNGICILYGDTSGGSVFVFLDPVMSYRYRLLESRGVATANEPSQE